MKLKYYIRGLGTGLIITTLILVIFRNTSSADNKLKEEETSSVTSVIAIKETENVTDKSTEKETEKVTEKPTDKETEKSTEKETEKVTEKPTENITSAEEKIVIIFKGVDTAYKAADILISAGLISDKNEFVMYMYNNGYDSKMQDGTYNLKKGDSLETIAKTITRMI